MKIFDENNKLLAIFIKSEKILDGKNFETEDEQELQLASFKLEKGVEIEKHYHPPQERKVSNTSEVLIMIEGEILVDIYDDNLKLISSEMINKGDTVALISGGHGLKIKKDARFIEVKQGPYIEEQDKVRF